MWDLWVNLNAYLGSISTQMFITYEYSLQGALSSSLTCN